MSIIKVHFLHTQVYIPFVFALPSGILPHATRLVFHKRLSTGYGNGGGG